MGNSFLFFTGSGNEHSVKGIQHKHTLKYHKQTTFTVVDLDDFFFLFVPLQGRNLCWLLMQKQCGCCPWGWGSRLNSCGVVWPLCEITIQSTVFPKETAESPTAAFRWRATPSNKNISLQQPIVIEYSWFPSFVRAGDLCNVRRIDANLFWIRALSGWGSRLYSLVGGIARSGDNYTVYCLPWGAHCALLNNRHRPRIAWLPLLSLWKCEKIIHCQKVSVSVHQCWIKATAHFNKVMIALNKLPPRQWMKSNFLLTFVELDCHLVVANGTVRSFSVCRDIII